MSDQTIPLSRRCAKCGKEYPVTTEWFYRNKNCRDGFHSDCKACVADYNRQYRAEHQRDINAKQRQYAAEHRSERKVYALQYRIEHRDKISATNRQYRAEHRDEINAHLRQYYAEHREIQRQYCAANRESISERTRQYRATNRDKRRDQRRQYAAEHREVYRAINHRRRARKRNLPATFTVADEQRMVGYFKGCCAVCGRPLNGLWHFAAADHWIAITDKRPDNPGTVATNMLPLCHGVDGCNNHKHDKDPVEWLTEKFGKRKAGQILKRITAYFEWTREDTHAHR